MLHLNGLLGHPATWLMLGAAWLGLGALTALAFGLIARVGAWIETSRTTLRMGLNPPTQEGEQWTLKWSKRC